MFLWNEIFKYLRVLLLVVRHVCWWSRYCNTQTKPPINTTYRDNVFFVSPIIRFLNLELRYLSHERGGGTNDRIVPLFSISEFFLAEKFRKKASLDRTSNSTREKYRPFVRFYFSRGRYTRIREINGKEKKKRKKKREKIKIRFDRSFLFLETAHFSRKKIFKINKSRGEKEGGGRGKARGWERRVVVEHKSNLAPPRERES